MKILFCGLNRVAAPPVRDGDGFRGVVSATARARGVDPRLTVFWPGANVHVDNDGRKAWRVTNGRTKASRTGGY